MSRKKKVPWPAPPGAQAAPSISLGEGDAAKVRGLTADVQRLKLELATALLQYEAAKGALLRRLGELDAKATSIVNDEAKERGLDPAKTSFDWATMSFKVAP